MTYKSGRWITWPEFNFAEENLTRLLAKVKPNFNTDQIVDDFLQKEKVCSLTVTSDDCVSSRGENEKLRKHGASFL